VFVREKRYVVSEARNVKPDLRITGFSDFMHRPVFENTTFRKIYMFPSSGEEGDTYSIGSLKKS
jgi:hypothetical protein